VGDDEADEQRYRQEVLDGDRPSVPAHSPLLNASQIMSPNPLSLFSRTIAVTRASTSTRRSLDSCSRCAAACAAARAFRVSGLTSGTSCSGGSGGSGCARRRHGHHLTVGPALP